MLATVHVSDKLLLHGVAAGALHGQVSTSRRAQAPCFFASGLVEVLIATALAARGLDRILLPPVPNASCFY